MSAVLDGVDVAVFDLGNVVCRFVPERRLAALAEATGRPPEDLHAALWGGPFSDDCDSGRLRSPAIHRHVVEATGFPGDLAALTRIWVLAFEPDPAVLDLVDQVRRRMPTAMLTDNPEILHDALPGLLSDVARRFDRTFFSFQLGICKPHTGVFAAVTAALGVDPGAVLFVDDSVRNVDAAQGAGWRAVRFTSAPALADALELVAP